MLRLLKNIETTSVGSESTYKNINKKLFYFSIYFIIHIEFLRKPIFRKTHLIIKSAILLGYYLFNIHKSINNRK